jgi:DNA repair protein RadC
MAAQPDFYEIPIVSLRIVRDSGVLVKRDCIKSPSDVATLLMDRMQDLDREVFAIVHLTTRNEVVAIENAFIGSLNSNHIRIADVFKSAILSNSAAILVAHNHPSGDPSPSPEDVSLTKSLVEAGELLDIQVMDHIIIGNGRFISLKERGLGGLK